jgi:mRNA-degrading endonuclease toxin of MazEF toxin-antitoxin module
LTIRRGDVWLVNFDPTKGRVSASTMDEVVAAIAAVIEYE